MKRTSIARLAFGFAAGLVLACGGCNKPTEPGAQNPQAGASQTGGAAALPSGTPDQAVAVFMEAVRTGDTEKTAGMLTSIAREKTAAAGLDVAPPGRATMKYQVGKVEYVTENKDGAHVLCTVTDEGGDGVEPRNDEIIWVLRRESEGWRIAGMVTRVIPNLPPLVLNYEDPDDMIRKLDLLQQEMEKQAAGEGSPAPQHDPNALPPGNQGQATLPSNNGPIRQ